MKRREKRYRAAETALWASVGATPIEEWVQLPGGENVRVQVVGEGPPILFLHGRSTSGAIWAPLVARLSGFRCFVVDRPGCGLSDPVAGGANITIPAQAESFAAHFVTDLLDGLDIERAHLVSTAFGGWFAFLAAAVAPDRVERIVELDWARGVPIGRDPVLMPTAAMPAVGALASRMPTNRFSFKVMLRQAGLGRPMSTSQVSGELVDWFASLLRDTDIVENEARANPAEIIPVQGMNRRMVLSNRALERITAPVLLIWGGDDPYSVEDAGRSFAGRFCDASLEVLPLAGHAPWIDEPQRCADLTAGFLAQART